MSAIEESKFQFLEPKKLVESKSEFKGKNNVKGCLNRHSRAASQI